MILMIAFYHFCIVSAVFNKDAVFYRCIIIENVCNCIFKGNKYIAHLFRRPSRPSNKFLSIFFYTSYM